MYLFTDIHSFHMQPLHIYPNCLDKYAVFETLLPSRYIAGKVPSLLSAEFGDGGDGAVRRSDEIERCYGDAVVSSLHRFAKFSTQKIWPFSATIR